MRFSLAAAAIFSLGLAACGDQQQEAGNGIATDQGYSVENSAGNDLTAIDAATADASGMAADAEANLLLDDLGNGEDGNLPAANTADENI
jgi:hypothetical protein